MAFYEFYQNNSGGKDKFDKNIGRYTIIEAYDAEHANLIAQGLGIYFDGIDAGIDCDCCGDRWHPVDESDAKDNFTRNWFMGPVILHLLNGTTNTLVE